MQYDEDDWQFTHHQKNNMLRSIQIDETAECERVGRNIWYSEHEYLDFRSPEEKRLEDIHRRLEKTRSSLNRCETELHSIRGTFETNRKNQLKIQINKLTREIELAESILDNE